ncbi:hypothetical protein BDV10DRAFT_199965 [Aspergillus recurvatus]
MQKTRKKFLTIFLYLFMFRYLRLLVNLFACWRLYKPASVPEKPTLHPSDCTVVLPTLDPTNPGFEECLTSCLTNEPGVLIIVVVGSDLTKTVKRIVSPYQTGFPSTKISVKTAAVANKRSQIAHGLKHVDTKITILLDDHVSWPSAKFLPTILAPFEDSRVGIVGTNARGLDIKSFWRMFGATDLARQTFENLATDAVGSGVGAVSSLTSAHRSSILTDPKFFEEFTNERFFFGGCGPLNTGEDSFITRWNVRHGYKIKIQYSEAALIETAHVADTCKDFLSHSLHRERTAWRSNLASLTDCIIWTRHPWSIYAVYLTSFVDFALFYDSALVYTLTKSTLGQKQGTLAGLLLAILSCKMVKLAPYFPRESRDLFMLPGYLLCSYVHSLVKLYALFTFWAAGYRDRAVDSITESPGSVSHSPAPAPTAAHLPKRVPAPAPGQSFIQPQHDTQTHHYTPAGRQTGAPIPQSLSQPPYAASSPVLRHEKRSVTHTEIRTSRSGGREG